MQSKKWKIQKFGTFAEKVFEWMNNSLCIVKKSLDDVLDFTLQLFSIHCIGVMLRQKRVNQNERS